MRRQKEFAYILKRHDFRDSHNGTVPYLEDEGNKLLRNLLYTKHAVSEPRESLS
jgi:hypothetical protein